MHNAASIKLVQEIVTRALINFEWYVEERLLSVNTMRTRNARTLKLSNVGNPSSSKYYDKSNYDVANVLVKTRRRWVHQTDTCSVGIVTVIYLMK